MFSSAGRFIDTENKTLRSPVKKSNSISTARDEDSILASIRQPDATQQDRMQGLLKLATQRGIGVMDLEKEITPLINSILTLDESGMKSLQLYHSYLNDTQLEEIVVKILTALPHKPFCLPTIKNVISIIIDKLSTKQADDLLEKISPQIGFQTAYEILTVLSLKTSLHKNPVILDLLVENLKVNADFIDEKLAAVFAFMVKVNEEEVQKHLPSIIKVLVNWLDRINIDYFLPTLIIRLNKSTLVAEAVFTELRDELNNLKITDYYYTAKVGLLSLFAEFVGAHVVTPYVQGLLEKLDDPKYSSQYLGFLSYFSQSLTTQQLHELVMIIMTKLPSSWKSDDNCVKVLKGIAGKIAQDDLDKLACYLIHDAIASVHRFERNNTIKLLQAIAASITSGIVETIMPLLKNTMGSTGYQVAHYHYGQGGLSQSLQAIRIVGILSPAYNEDQLNAFSEILIKKFSSEAEKEQAIESMLALTARFNDKQIARFGDAIAHTFDYVCLEKSALYLFDVQKLVLKLVGRFNLNQRTILINTVSRHLSRMNFKSGDNHLFNFESLRDLTAHFNENHAKIILPSLILGLQDKTLYYDVMRTVIPLLTQLTQEERNQCIEKILKDVIKRTKNSELKSDDSCEIRVLKELTPLLSEEHRNQLISALLQHHWKCQDPASDWLSQLVVSDFCNENQLEVISQRSVLLAPTQLPQLIEFYRKIYNLHLATILPANSSSENVPKSVPRGDAMPSANAHGFFDNRNALVTALLREDIQTVVSVLRTCQKNQSLGPILRNANVQSHPSKDKILANLRRIISDFLSDDHNVTDLNLIDTDEFFSIEFITEINNDLELNRRHVANRPKELRQQIQVNALLQLCKELETMIGSDTEHFPKNAIFQPLLSNIETINANANRVLRRLCSSSHPKAVLLVKALYKHEKALQLDPFQLNKTNDCAMQLAEKNNPAIHLLLTDHINKMASDFFVKMAAKNR